MASTELNSLRMGSTESMDPHEQWLASAARLPKHAFRQIAHPSERSFLGIPLQTRETWEMYATYYEAMIHATEAGQTTLPKLYELCRCRTPRHRGKPYQPKCFRTELGSFPPSAEGNRCKVATRIARDRLAAPERTNHRAESSCPESACPHYDPFSGLPMLWSPTQQKIYSVGKDRYG